MEDIAIVIGIIPIIALILSAINPNILFRGKLSRKQALVVCILAFVASSFFATSLVPKENQQPTKQAGIIHTPTIALSPAQIVASEYKIISDTKDEATHKIVVLITKKDNESLTRYNEELKKLDKRTTNIFTIDYFDDETTATSYFDKMFDNNLTEEQANVLYQHYIANYKRNKATGYDSLSLRGDKTGEVIKAY